MSGVSKGDVAVVRVDGSILPPDYVTATMAVRVDQRINAPARCELVFNPVSTSGAPNKGLDFEIFALGAELSASIGYFEAVPIFAGEIAAVSPVFSKTERQGVITAYDRSFRMQFGAKTRTFEEETYSEIAERVMTEAGQAGEADPTEALQPYVAQNQCSDYDFLLSLGERTGYELLSTLEGVMFRKPRLTDPPVSVLEYSSGLIEFMARARVLTQGSSVTRVGWNPLEKLPIEGMAETSEPEDRMEGEETGFEMSEVMDISPIASPDASITDEAGAEELAMAVRGQLLDTFITAEALCVGNTDISAGSIVEIQGVSTRFNGPYYVHAAKHEYAVLTGYRTWLELERTGA